MGLVIRSLFLEKHDQSKFSKKDKLNWSFVAIYLSVSVRHEGLNNECV